MLQPIYFDNLEIDDDANLLNAHERWHQYRLSVSQVTSQSRVLEIGCGQGNTSIWLAQQTECEVVGIDKMSASIDDAQTALLQHKSLPLTFQTVDFPHLPFPDQSFTHIWSQNTLSQLPQIQQVLAEIERVLQVDGILILDDLVAPIAEDSELAKESVEHSHLMACSLTPKAYTECLNRLGLMVLDSLDLTTHLRKSYELQLSYWPTHGLDGNSEATFKQTIDAIDAGKLGWWFYSCKKVGDRLQWIHNNNDTDELRRKYDAWAALYEADLDNSWLMPVHAAHLLEQLQTDPDPYQDSSKEIAILDAGAGTGKVGQALSQLGYNNITAVDLSVGMLEEARQKQVYTALYPANLEEPLTFAESETFDVITAIGVFTYGHASPAGLHHLLPLLKPGGLFLITVRASNQPMLDAFKELSWSLVKQEDYEFETAPFYLLAYRKH
ncbi:MAG: methyltransferase domain-containing protein [Cyanobacteria bacterium P01_B01_bin.77]